MGCVCGGPYLWTVYTKWRYSTWSRMARGRSLTSSTFGFTYQSTSGNKMRGEEALRTWVIWGGGECVAETIYSSSDGGSREKKNSTDGVRPCSEGEKRRVLSEFAKKENKSNTWGSSSIKMATRCARSAAPMKEDLSCHMRARKFQEK